jgi:hypothetical protein
LSFGFVFNQSLERVTVPSSIQSLTLGCGFNQPKPGEGVLAIKPSKLQCWLFITQGFC